MSSTETSGAPAEATVTSQPAGESAAAASFGSTRGSGLARGKRPSNSPASTAATAPASEYKPTAIAVLNAPREYQNPFAPAPDITEPPFSYQQPAAAHPEPTASVTPAPAAVAPVATAPQTTSAPTPAAPVQPADELFPLDDQPAHRHSEPEESSAKAELNILPPAQAKTTPAQTWESDGFQPARESRSERPRREDRPARESFENAPIPEKFLYVRPGHTYVPTPSNYGGAPREDRRSVAPAPAPARTETPAPQKSGGIFGWLKSLFGSETPATTATPSGETNRDNGSPQRRQRSGGRNYGGDQTQAQGADGREGGFRRRRGGRGRGRSGYGQGGQGGSSQGGGH